MRAGDSIHADFGDNVGMFTKEHFTRRTDSPTSKAAVSIPKIRGEVARILKAADEMITGFTALELHNHSGIDYIVIQKRLSVLQRGGYIEKSEPGDSNFIQRSGRAVWRRTEKEAVYL